MVRYRAPLGLEGLHHFRGAEGNFSLTNNTSGHHTSRHYRGVTEVTAAQKGAHLRTW